MNINPINSKVSFSAKLNENTRKVMREYDESLDSKFDDVIANSALADFGGDETTITLGTYRFSDGWENSTFASAVVNTKINGKDIKVGIPTFGHPYFDLDREDSVAAELSVYKYTQNNVLDAIQSANIKEIKTLLAKEYIRQSAKDMIDNATDKTFDELKSGEIKFPKI